MTTMVEERGPKPVGKDADDVAKSSEVGHVNIVEIHLWPRVLMVLAPLEWSPAPFGGYHPQFERETPTGQKHRMYPKTDLWGSERSITYTGRHFRRHSGVKSA